MSHSFYASRSSRQPVARPLRLHLNLSQLEKTSLPQLIKLDNFWLHVTHPLNILSLIAVFGRVEEEGGGGKDVVYIIQKY